MKRGNENNMMDPNRNQGNQDFVGNSGAIQYPNATGMSNIAMPNQSLMMGGSSQFMGGRPVQQRFDGMHSNSMQQMPQSWNMTMASSSTTAAEEAAAEEARNVRGGYKCSKCGLPKKGHVCAYQPRLRRRDEDETIEKRSISTQVEIDPLMTVRELDLEIQGTAESYPHLMTNTFNSDATSPSSTIPTNDDMAQGGFPSNTSSSPPPPPTADNGMMMDNNNSQKKNNY